MRNLLIKLGLLGLQSEVPRRNLNSLSLLFSQAARARLVLLVTYLLTEFMTVVSAQMSVLRDLQQSRRASSFGPTLAGALASAHCARGAPRVVPLSTNVHRTFNESMPYHTIPYHTTHTRALLLSRLEG